jgi:(p)ppGpp synthase/HD superfamily hydrolase
MNTPLEQCCGSPRLDAAIVFATRAHAGRFRKGTDTPYITHPFAVAMILALAGFEEDVIIAGLLHDTVEDAGVSVEEIRQRFGDAVAEIVAGCSEPDKSLPWEERKRHTLEALRTAPLGVRAVTCADKLHNLRSLRADHAVLGDQIWKRFNRGRAEQAWLFQKLASCLVEASAGHPDAPLCRQFAAEVSTFFGPSNE